MTPLCAALAIVAGAASLVVFTALCIELLDAQAKAAEAEAMGVGLAEAFNEAYAAVRHECAMGALAERVAEGYRSRAHAAESDVSNAQAQWECDGLSLTLRNVEIVGLTAERDIARGELDTARQHLATAQSERDTWQARYTELHADYTARLRENAFLRAYIDTLHADLAHGALFRVAGGRLGTWEQWVEWKTAVGAVAGTQEAVA